MAHDRRLGKSKFSVCGEDDSYAGASLLHVMGRDARHDVIGHDIVSTKDGPRYYTRGRSAGIGGARFFI